VGRDRLIALGLAALGLALGLAQRPGETSADTKISLHVDPVGFLGEVASAWSPTEDLGHVQGGQYGGYLFPMGPVLAAGRLLGLDPWLVHRLWLGALLAFAAYGTVRLLDALLGRPRGAGHVVAGLLVLLNPYVVVFSARTTVTLLGYAALPWLLLAVHRGLRAPRSWWWPAVFALVLTCTGGGVNAAVTAWLLLGPVLLALYERFVDGRPLLAFAWRTAVVTALASVWWVVPVLVQARHGVDFLRFTEQAGTIWSTTSLSESLRLMGYWLSYLGVGYGGELRPLFSSGGAMLFSAPIVIAGLLVPALALSGFLVTRRWRYGPFFLLLVLVGLVVMAAGFPEGTPLRRALNFTYNNVEAVRFLRTSYKAGPLVALGIACLAGAAVAWLRSRWAAVAVVALAVVAAWPLATGRALDTQLLYDRVPAAWSDAADHVDATVGDDRRGLVLPGQLYAYYEWGGTVDHVLPALADKPVAVRYAVPYANLRSVDLLWTLDGLVQQRRALPGQLEPLLDLVSAGVAVAGADDDRTRSGAVPAGTAAEVLDQLGPADETWGPVRPEPRAAGTLGGPRSLPRVRAWDRPSARPLVRVEPDDGFTVVDGGADGIAALAALGSLPDRLVYAGDVDAAELRRAGEVVITDSHRRRVLAAARMAQNHGATLPADEPFPPDAAVLDLFPERGSDGQTVAVLDGVEALRAPYSPAFPQFPERRPYAAFDGDLATHWQADRALVPERHWLEVTFERPLDVGAVELVPYSDRTGRVTQVEIAGRRFDVHPGRNRLQIGLRDVRSLRVRIARVVRRSPDVKPNPGGLRELVIPGVRVREALRPPVLAERALAGHDLSATGLSYVFERTTGDDPFRRDPRRGSAGAGLVRDRLDGETGLERLIALPAARRWSADGWATIASDAPDSEIDRLAGVRGRFASSGRFEGRPGARASSAFDGTPRAWIGSFEPGRPAWIEWTVPRAATISELRLAPPRERVRRPTLVRLGGMTVPVQDGTVTLARPVRGRRFRLEILEAEFPAGTPGVIRQRRAVGIGEIEGAGVPRVDVPRSGPLNARCGDLAGSVGDQRVALRAEGDIADLDAGTPLRVRGCGAPVSLPAGPARLSMPAGVLAPYLIRLRSPAPDAPAPAAAGGQVVDSGDPGRNDRRGIRLRLDAPAWLVLGQAYNAAWRASCDGRDLGAPQPVDGYAMGWRVDAGCQLADLWFAPDRLVRLGYWISVPVVLALVLLLLLRRPPPARDDTPADLAETDRVPRLPARRAAVAALVAGAALGFLFAARSAPLIALAAFLVLWRGIGTRALIAAAAALLIVVVPVLTLAIPVRDAGGYNFEYAQDRIAVHWVVVAAVVLLVLALARTLSTARARRADAPRSAP
jgi:arabinofuranan 3-O-arabinosyltransferase